MHVRTACAILLCLWTAAAAAQSADRDALKAFYDKANDYVELHRRVEGPVPPLHATSDIAEVKRRMQAVRARIRAKMRPPARGHIFTSDVTMMFRKRIAELLTREEIAAVVEDVEEHTPPNMPALRLFEPLPEDAPFAPLPPRLFKQLPALSPELRYLVLNKSLVLWDHHADLIVDIAPGLFDPRTYRGTSP